MNKARLCGNSVITSWANILLLFMVSELTLLHPEELGFKAGKVFLEHNNKLILDIQLCEVGRREYSLFVLFFSFTFSLRLVTLSSLCYCYPMIFFFFNNLLKIEKKSIFFFFFQKLI